MLEAGKAFKKSFFGGFPYLLPSPHMQAFFMLLFILKIEE